MKEKPQKIMHIKDETWKIAEYSAKAKKHKWNTVDCDFLSFFEAFSLKPSFKKPFRFWLISFGCYVTLVSKYDSIFWRAANQFYSDSNSFVHCYTTFCQIYLKIKLIAVNQ